MNLGLLAGSGKLPIEFLKEAKRRSISVTTFAISNVTDRNIERLSSQTIWIEPFKLGKFLKSMKKNKITHIAMLGKVEHRSIFSLKNLDFKAIRFLTKLKDKRAKPIIMAMIEEIEGEGVEVINPSDFLKNLLVSRGILCGRFDEATLREAEFGFDLARRLASMEIGQTVVVKDNSVVAVEAMEGTDDCIERAGSITKDFVVCKAAREKQDLRVDIPTIGIKTINTISRNYGRALAIESNKTFIIDKNDLVLHAERLNIPIIAL